MTLSSQSGIDGGWTKGEWRLDRMESAAEFAALKGETLAEHEGYYRDNNGDWIVTFRDPDDEIGGRIAAVSFKGSAKRGQTHNAPDPEGQANARLISAAKDLYYALKAASEFIEGIAPGSYALQDCRAALRKALPPQTDENNGE